MVYLSILHLNKIMNRDYSLLDSFIIYMCIEGTVEIHYLDEKILLSKGVTLLIPAEIKYLKLIPKMESKILEIYI